MGIVSFWGYSWDTNNLQQCEIAYKSLLNEGFSSEELSELDFGELDTNKVECDMYELY